MPVERWFDKVASVYAPASNFQTAVKTDLACTLRHYNIEGLATGSDRAELMATRLLMWEPEYAMPEGSQVLIDGERWQVARGGQSLVNPGGTANAYRRAHVVRTT